MTEPSEAATAGPDVPGAVLLPGLESVEPGEPAAAPPDAATIAGPLESVNPGALDDPALVARTGREAWELARERFSAHAVARAADSLYHSLPFDAE